MLNVQDSISKFQRKISTYDKANWEIIVEKCKYKHDVYDGTELKGPSSRWQFIDLDLFRGKTFHKAKPTYHWNYVTMKAIVKMAFYPFYYSWWIDQLEFSSFLLFLGVYVMQLAIALIYFLSPIVQMNYSPFQMFSSTLMTVLVGQIFVHVVSTNLTRPNNIVSQRSIIDMPSKKPHRRSSSACNSHHLEQEPVKFEQTPTEKVKRRHAHNIKKLNSKFSLDDLAADVHDSVPNIFISYKEEDSQVCTEGSPVERDKISMSREENEVCLTESAAHISHSSSSLSDSEQKDHIFGSVGSVQPSIETAPQIAEKSPFDNDIVVTMLNEDGVKKFKMNLWEIVKMIDERVNMHIPESKYFTLIMVFCVYFSLIPLLFEASRIYFGIYLKENRFYYMDLVTTIVRYFRDTPPLVLFVMFLIIASRFIIFGSFLFLLCVAERTYKIRYLYAKYFGALTSSRRARRSMLPHFRLHKVRNIKVWLSLRSYLRRMGPIRSIDLIVSFTFFLTIVLTTFVCSQLLMHMDVTDVSDSGYISKYSNWEVPSCTMLFTTYLLRFMSLGAEVNRKYNNHSELLTEQINLYLQMEISPQKKEEFIISNNVLKLASKLLKELEAPYKVTGFIMNPLLRNITRVVILSLVSGVFSEIMGIRFKFWKIKAS